jgi:hypothetical protein
MIVGQLFQRFIAIAIAAAIADMGDPAVFLPHKQGDQSRAHAMQAGVASRLREDEMIGVGYGFAKQGRDAEVGNMQRHPGIRVALCGFQVMCSGFRWREGSDPGGLRFCRGKGFTEVTKHGVDSHTAGDFASGRATHAIAYDEETLVGTDAEGVFVRRADPALVGGGGSLMTVLTQLRHAGSMLYSNKP